jgi:addiction module HigA family antidote
MIIRSVRHRGLLRLIEDDDGRELRSDLVRRLRNILAVLIAATDISGVTGPPGWRVHQLRGRPCRDMEHFGKRQLAPDLWHSAERNLRPRLGGLSLMSRAPARIAMAPPHPGMFIREEILDELGLSVSEVAKVLDVRRATLSDLINGNAALSAEMALRIEKAFGVEMETLLNMQAWHDAHAMRQREGEIAVKKPYRPPAPEPG